MAARKRRRVLWQPDKGRYLCEVCRAPHKKAESSPCCGAPLIKGHQRMLLTDYRDVYDVLMAGSVGGGKTDAGLACFVYYKSYRDNPRFGGLVLRYSKAGEQSAREAFAEFYQRVESRGFWGAYVGGSLNRTRGLYRFNSGGQVLFATSEHIKALQGPQFQCVYIDEMTHWPDENELLYILATRVRSADGLPIRIRAGTNPGGPGHEWVTRRYGPWLAGDYLAANADGADLYTGAASLRALGYVERRSEDGRALPPCDSGHILSYVLDEQGRETWVAPGTPGALTRTCLLSRTSDNVALASSDPAYQMRARAVAATRGGGVTAAQLLENDWSARAAEGDMFPRASFPVVRAIPVLDGVVRRWDLAYTLSQDPNYNARLDWTVGIKLGWWGHGANRQWIIIDLIRLKGLPGKIKATIKETAAADGRCVPIVVPVDSVSGNYVAADLTGELAGYQVHTVRERDKKEQRITALQSQVQVKRIHLLEGAWNLAFLDEASHYPDVRHDDQLDALAGAFGWSIEQTRGPSREQVRQDVDLARQISQKIAQVEAVQARRPLGGGSRGGGTGAPPI